MEEMIMPGIMSEGSIPRFVPNCAALLRIRSQRPDVWDQPQSAVEFPPQPGTESRRSRLCFDRPRRRPGPKDHVKILDGQQVGLTSSQPLLLGQALAFWAMSIAAGAVADAQ